MCLFGGQQYLIVLLERVPDVEFMGQCLNTQGNVDLIFCEMALEMLKRVGCINQTVIKTHSVNIINENK